MSLIRVNGVELVFEIGGPDRPSYSCTARGATVTGGAKPPTGSHGTSPWSGMTVAATVRASGYRAPRETTCAISLR